MTVDRPPVIRCFSCSGEGAGQYGIVACRTCQGTGSVFWVSGRAIPYTPAGEKAAMKLAEQDQ